MSKAIVYGLIPGFSFDGFEGEITFERGIIISLAPQDIISKLLDSCSETLSTEDRKDIEGISYAIRIETEDSNKAIDKAIKNIHTFIATLRIVKPIIAYPQYFFSHHHEGKYYFLRIKGYLDFCYAIDADIEMHKFSVDLKPEIESLWMNMPQIVQNKGRVWMAHWLNEKAYLEKYHEFRVLFSAIALESLFSIDELRLTHNLSMRAAKFLSADPTERDKIYRRVRFAYNIRSMIAHGLKEEISHRQLWCAEIIFREGVRQSLFKIMSDSNLISIFDGKLQDYVRYFNSL